MTFKRALILGLASALIVSAVSPAFAQKKSQEPIKVFVLAATSGGGFRDPLTDSAIDIERALYKKNQIVGVPSQDADVKIEVLERRGEPLTMTMVFVRLTAGDYSLDISGQDSTDFVSWKGTAKDVAFTIERWIKANHDRLIVQRVQK